MSTILLVIAAIVEAVLLVLAGAAWSASLRRGDLRELDAWRAAAARAGIHEPRALARWIDFNGPTYRQTILGEWK